MVRGNLLPPHILEIDMNSDTLKGQWNQLKGGIKKQWADLTDDDLLAIEGSRDKLIGKLQERYGHSRDAAEREVRVYSDRNQIDW
jgi:uncharacterized protein YjbJ (UPF0337 family)